MNNEEPKWRIGNGRFGRAKRLWQCLNRLDGQWVDGVGADLCVCPVGYWYIGYSLLVDELRVGADSISAHLGKHKK